MRQSVLFVAVIRNFVVSANVVCLAVERLAASFKPQMVRYRYAYATVATTGGMTGGMTGLPGGCTAMPGSHRAMMTSSHPWQPGSRWRYADASSRSSLADSSSRTRFG